MNSVMLGVIVIALFVLAGCQGNEPLAEPATQPGRILGLEEAWELVPKADYFAEQKGGQVTVTARGESPTAGYRVKLVQSPLRIWPPQWMLAHKRPEGMVAQVITPFEVTASFKASEPVKHVVVNDAAGKHQVKVDQTRD